MEGTGATIVVKVGGSLLDWPDLSASLANFLADHANDRLILIVGGGAAADFVREMDRVHGLGETKAHALAIRSLDLTARALAAIVAGLVVAESVDELATCWRLKQVPILAPRVPLEADATPLPASWDVTTDSIAARIAATLGAALLLLKSTDTPDGTTREQAATLGLVDPRFPHEASSILRVTMVNLRDPARPEVELCR